MNPLVLALILLPAIGLIAGVGLGVAAHFMKVEENEKAKALRACLPGANCGACGFSGCSGYADALAESPNLRTNLCTVGGDGVAKAISEILGTKAEKTVPRRAVVRCAGTHDAREKKALYEGVSTCRAAAMVQNGGNGCAYGCLGFGDCARACDNDAISVLNGVAVVEEDKCFACGKCAAACPKSIIEIIPKGEYPYAACMNVDKGAETKAVCSAGCIGCRACLKACESGAIEMIGARARIDSAKCTACGKCVAACKFGVIKKI